MLAVQVIIDTLAPEEGLVHHPVPFSAVQSGSRAVGVLVAVRVVQRVVGHLTVKVVHRGINVRHVYTPRRRFFSHFSKYTVTLLQDGGNMTAHLIRVVILVAGTVVKVAHVRVIRYLVVELDHRVFRLPDIQFREVRLQSAVRIVINVARELYRTHQGARVRSVAIRIHTAHPDKLIQPRTVILAVNTGYSDTFHTRATAQQGFPVNTWTTVKDEGLHLAVAFQCQPAGGQSAQIFQTEAGQCTGKVEQRHGRTLGKHHALHLRTAGLKFFQLGLRTQIQLGTGTSPGFRLCLVTKVEFT